MSVKKITTLGCNPLLMLHKMGDVNGVEILESDSFERWGQTYYTRVVCQHPSGMYIEAKDDLNAEMGLVSDRRFCVMQNRIDSNSGGSAPAGHTLYLDRQELTTGDLESTLSFIGGEYNLTWSGIYAPDQPSLATDSSYSKTLSNVSISSIFNTVSNNPSHSSYGGVSLGRSQNSEVLFGQGGGLIAPFGKVPNVQSVISYVSYGVKFGFSTGNPPAGWVTYLQMSGVFDEFTLGRKWGNRLNYTENPGKYYLNEPMLSIIAIAHNHSVGIWRPLLYSGGAIRMASNIDGSGELVNPSPWTEFPVHCECVSTDDGLWFINAGTYDSYANSSYKYVGYMDTSRGNNFGDGKAPVVMRMNRLSAGANLTISPYIQAIGANAVGDGGVKTLSEYTPVLPIGNDVYAGGPVVGNIFGHTVDEVRGVFPDLLSCHTSLALGTSGWLDGKRYSVFRPGKMMRVG
ncbi:MAG: hypothetical protein EOM03_10570 [Clostridia bacterium]|nr:hypothetical protein [Clostridia bacterium]